MHVSRVKSISCNMCNSGYVPLSPQLLPPLFLLSLCPGSALPLKARLQLPCCAPLSPGRRRPCPQEGSPHSPPLLAGCCAGMAGHTLRNKGPVVSEPATSRAITSEPLPTPGFSATPGPKKNARFSFAGKRHHLAILRVPRLQPRRREIWLGKPT